MSTSGTIQSKPYHLEPHDKVTQVTLYTTHMAIRGEIVTRSAVRVSNWLRLPGLPAYAPVYCATARFFPGAGNSYGRDFLEFHVPLDSIIAMHMTPPICDPVDYDPLEKNRKMEPVTVMTGPFLLSGLLRMPTQQRISQLLENMRDPFMMLFDTEVACVDGSIGVTRTPIILVRPSACCFTPTT
jgi:hypothetical protein